MAVLIEGIAVVVRRDAISTSFAGGWTAFKEVVRGMIYCADDELACVHFTSGVNTDAFLATLGNMGLVYRKEGNSADFAVVHQSGGAYAPATWLEFADVPLDRTSNRVTVCWLFDSPRIMGGLHTKSLKIAIALPDGWNYKGSLSATKWGDSNTG